ncbi:hypothetical protein MOST_18120 [Moorella stamsii]|uniref:Uncharacterized protein n=1 Tax=Neomoorella stamsii TaxID=1266720 RepID=A0A9X7J2H4_9FIRM|nr:hypothetical protein MOST_18120 [Moorella stamsii]
MLAKSITEINIKNKNSQWGGGGIICLDCKYLERSFPSINPLKITANNIPPNLSSATFHNASGNQNFLVIFGKKCPRTTRLMSPFLLLRPQSSLRDIFLLCK